MSKTDQATAPFTTQQVKNINAFQKSGVIHPFTCCTPKYCDRKGLLDDRTLTAKEDGLHCKCGKMPPQTWVHKGMAEFNKSEKS